ncbi:MAG TPA: hypothetical protein VN922_09030, partial [Bacteroidia bacterium]|nr:hypothetical protein [Bacteroidia bacterium]
SYYNYQGLYLDNYTTTEQNVNVNAHLFTYIEKQRIDVKALVQYYNEDNVLASSHAWDLGLNPYFSASEKHWDAHLGLKAYLDAVNGGTDIFPDLLVRYHIADDALIVYAGIDGDKEYNSYKSLSTDNPYIQDTVSNMYTRTMYHLFLGFTGSITKEITYDINGSQSEIKGMPFYVTDTNEFYRNRFAVVYDNVKIVNVHADLGYQLKENIRVVLGGDLYQYMTTDQLQAWYHPTLKINLGGEYRVNEKLLLKTTLIFVNSQYAPEYVNGVLTAKTLAGYPDLNLGADYKYNKLLTVFLHLNNLANTAYMQWDNYPTQRFNFLLGVRLTF